MAAPRKNATNDPVACKAHKVRFDRASKQGGDHVGSAAAFKALGEIK